MSKYVLSTVVIGSICLASCAGSHATSGASCRQWDEMAQKSQNHDHELVVRYNALMAKAAGFHDEMEKHHNDARLRQSLIEKEVQARLYADAVFDTNHYLEVAKMCWNSLREAQEIRDSAWRQRQIETPAQPQFQPPRADYTLHSQPPAPPPPAQLHDNGGTYLPSRPDTWGNSPYAPMVPPVMRGQPVENVNPMIPPVAR